MKNSIRVMLFVALIVTAISVQAEMTIVNEDQTNLAATIVPIVVKEEPEPVILSVKPGSLLRDTLNEWAHQSGWSLVWGLSEQDDYRLEAGNNYPGDFKEAVHGLINSLPPAVRIHAELRPDNAPPLLYITIEEGAR